MVSNLERLASQLKGDPQLAVEVARLNIEVTTLRKQLEGSTHGGISEFEIALVLLLVLVAVFWQTATAKQQETLRKIDAESERTRLVLELLARWPGGAASLPELRKTMDKLVDDVANVGSILGKP
jgi:hypothetical protein